MNEFNYNDACDCNNSKNEFTNVILNEELKQLVYKEINTAQDINSPFYLSKLTSYEIYHDELKNHFIRLYGKKPTQTDNLAFMLLLTYPKKNIERFKNFTDLKLAFNNRSEESDFESIGFTIFDGFGEANCICNEDIMNVHIFRNKYSGVNIQLGSVCNTRYGLISKNDPYFKSTCKKIKEYKEKEKERVEGKPEGYYENERRVKKQLAEELKLKKIEEKETKKREKELNKLNKKEPGSFKIKNCMLCNKEGIYKITETVICSMCISTEIKSNQNILNYYIRNNKAYSDCVSCELEFVNIKNKSCELCKQCRKIWTFEKCKMCPENFLKQKDINDLYCLDCDSKITNCIDCKRDILEPSNRCYKCEYKFTNNLYSFICNYCEKEEYITEKELWKTKLKIKNCKECYKKLIKEINCILCNNTFKILPHETWKTKCRECC